MGFRVEKDFLGERQIADEAYYGIQTVRAVENFPISGIRVHPEMIMALAEVKKACALANMDLRRLNRRVGEAIVQAADEVRQGLLLEHFIVDSIQGGAGTSINMNMNEVVANRSLEILGLPRGQYGEVNPNNHVNMSQSTNDTIPTAIRIAAYRLTQQLLEELEGSQQAWKRKRPSLTILSRWGAPICRMRCRSGSVRSSALTPDS